MVVVDLLEDVVVAVNKPELAGALAGRLIVEIQSILGHQHVVAP